MGARPHRVNRAGRQAGRALRRRRAMDQRSVEPLGEDALDRSAVGLGVPLGRALRSGRLLARLRLRDGLLAGRLGEAALEEVGRTGGRVPPVGERPAAHRDEAPHGPERRGRERELQREPDSWVRRSTGRCGRRVFGYSTQRARSATLSASTFAPASTSAARVESPQVTATSSTPAALAVDDVVPAVADEHRLGGRRPDARHDSRSPVGVRLPRRLVAADHDGEARERGRGRRGSSAPSRPACSCGPRATRPAPGEERLDAGVGARAVEAVRLVVGPPRRERGLEQIAARRDRPRDQHARALADEPVHLVARARRGAPPRRARGSRTRAGRRASRRACRRDRTPRAGPPLLREDRELDAPVLRAPDRASRWSRPAARTRTPPARAAGGRRRPSPTR